MGHCTIPSATNVHVKNAHNSWISQSRARSSPPRLLTGPPPSCEEESEQKPSLVATSEGGRDDGVLARGHAHPEAHLAHVDVALCLCDRLAVLHALFYVFVAAAFHLVALFIYMSCGVKLTL